MKTRTRNCFLGLVLLVGLVTPCWTLALTTFGKSSPNTNNQNQNQNQNDRQTGTNARECATDMECAGIKGTSCLQNIFGDNKMRCLCGNYKESQNGRCTPDLKRVKAMCNNNNECTPGAMCMKGNDTTLQGNRCWCTSSFTVDEDMLCSGAEIAIPALLLIASLLIANSL